MLQQRLALIDVVREELRRELRLLAGRHVRPRMPGFENGSELLRHEQALDYLHQRGLHKSEIIDQLGIGYAPGGCVCAGI